MPNLKHFLLIFLLVIFLPVFTIRISNSYLPRNLVNRVIEQVSNPVIDFFAKKDFRIGNKRQ